MRKAINSIGESRWLRVARYFLHSTTDGLKFYQQPNGQVIADSLMPVAVAFATWEGRMLEEERAKASAARARAAKDAQDAKDKAIADQEAAAHAAERAELERKKFEDAKAEKVRLINLAKKATDDYEFDEAAFAKYSDLLSQIRAGANSVVMAFAISRFARELAERLPKRQAEATEPWPDDIPF